MTPGKTKAKKPRPRPKPKANLGCASTGELLAELRARFETDAVQEGGAYASVRRLGALADLRAECDAPTLEYWTVDAR